ncbi:hypothetical protein [Salinigranum sp.]|uniref:hypothetical protein n=1 Tax=Salinigranum sp. TaxID=1966351 RepID=UPI0035642059
MSSDSTLSTAVEAAQESFVEAVDTDDDGSLLGSEGAMEAVTQAVDTDEVEALFSEGEAVESVGRELGSRVGAELGSTVGRELGGVVVRDVRERKSLRTILVDVARRLVELLAALLRNADVGSAASRLRDAFDSATDVTDEVTDDADAEDDEETQTTDDADAEDDEETQTADEDADSESGGSSGGLSDMSADDLEQMREETYRELLEVMSYRDMQSIAKELDVKANLSEDELTERIVEQFAEQTNE